MTLRQIFVKKKTLRQISQKIFDHEKKKLNMINAVFLGQND